MRKTFFTHFFIWCLALGFAFTTFAQDQSAGRIPDDIQKGDVNYWYSNDPIDSETAYGWTSQAGNFVSFPVPEGTPFTVIAPMVAPGFLSSACFGPTGILYFTDTSTSELYVVDKTTGALTLVGSTTVGLNGITYDASTGLFFAVSSTDLYTIDVGTGATTLVGTLGTGGLMIDVAATCDGLLYAYDLVSDSFYSIDKTTGLATLIGPIGFNANFGQGLSFDYNTGVLYMSAFDGTGFTGQLRSVDLATGATTVLFDWGLEQIAPFAIDTQCGPPCPVGQATNPNPPSGAVDQPLALDLTWTNGSGATSIEVFFDGVSVYSGAPITIWSVSGLDYSTGYAWRVDGSDGSCTTAGATWTFTTMDDPNIVNLFCDDFTAGSGNWTITNDGGDCVWEIHDASEYTLPPTAVGNVLAADADFCGSGTTLLSTATHTGVDATLYQTVWLEFDNDWQAIDADDFAMVDVSVDGGTTWQNVLTFDVVDIRNTHEVWDLTALVALNTFDIRFVSVQPGWDWWWAVDNVCIYGTDIVPVELTSFAANVNDGNVTLNWSTATETNNQGFEVQRSSNGSEFAKVGYVAGHGTVTESQSYVFTDNTVNTGSYAYRLKQIDFGGAYEYSEVIEVEVDAPAEFSLNQNYPNPFNPSTIIEFNLAVDSKVTLTIFDVLGQEVVTLINGNLAAGTQEFNFDASALNSGVYFYRIDASGVDGTNFSSVKKMILSK